MGRCLAHDPLAQQEAVSITDAFVSHGVDAATDDVNAEATNLAVLDGCVESRGRYGKWVERPGIILDLYGDTAAIRTDLHAHAYDDVVYARVVVTVLDDVGDAFVQSQIQREDHPVRELMRRAESIDGNVQALEFHDLVAEVKLGDWARGTHANGPLPPRRLSALARDVIGERETRDECLGCASRRPLTQNVRRWVGSIYP